MNFLSTGEKIKRARIYKGMTLKELCQKDISISRMSCIENGKVIPEKWVLELVADRLKLDLDYLLCDDISQLKRTIKKFDKEDIVLNDKECAEIVENIGYAISKEYYDLGFKLMHILTNYYIEHRKIEKIEILLNDYNLLYERNYDLSNIYYEDLANYFMIRRNYKDAITYLNLLDENIKLDLQNNIEHFIKINIFRAICLYGISELNECETVIIKTINIADKTNDKDSITLLNGLNVIINISKEIEYNKELGIFESGKSKYEYLYAKIKILIGEAFLSKGYKDKGMKQLREGIAVIPKENTINYAEILLLVSRVMINSKEFSEASTYCEEALQMSIHLDNIVYIEIAYYLKSRLAKSQGSFIQWEMFMNLSMDLLLKFGSYTDKYERYLEMANMYHVIGETRESLKYLSLSLENSRKLY